MPPKRTSRPRSLVPVESRAAEILTIGWMLAVTVTLCAELGWLFARGYMAWQGPQPTVDLLARLCLFTALVAGLISLGLAASALRARSVPPPAGVLAVATAIGAAPLVLALV